MLSSSVSIPPLITGVSVFSAPSATKCIGTAQGQNQNDQILDFAVLNVGAAIMNLS